MKSRLVWLAAAFGLLAAEVIIALFVHDNFIRPYLGDVLVVIVLYLFVRSLVPKGVPLLPLYLFLFAAGVEVLQYFQIVRRLGLQDIPFSRILIGSVFDVADILCYGVGCLFLAVCEGVKYRKEKPKEKPEEDT